MHAAYARIQVAEARIAHAAHGLDEAGDRPARCEEICDASAAIRGEARALEGDADAAERAARAERTCAACAEAAP